MSSAVIYKPYKHSKHTNTPYTSYKTIYYTNSYTKCINSYTNKPYTNTYTKMHRQTFLIISFCCHQNELTYRHYLTFN